MSTPAERILRDCNSRNRWTVYKDYISSQILQHLFRIRHQTAFGRNNCEEIFRELFSQGLILHSYRLQRIRKKRCQFSSSFVIFPHHIQSRVRYSVADKSYNNDRTNQNNVRMNISDRLLQKYREHYGKSPDSVVKIKKKDFYISSTVTGVYIRNKKPMC